MKSSTLGLGLLKANVITGHKCNKSHLQTQIKGNITFENLLVQCKDLGRGGGGRTRPTQDRMSYSPDQNLGRGEPLRVSNPDLV